MKIVLKILGVLVFLALLAVVRSEWLEHQLRASVEQTRRDVRQKKFRTDLADFDFSLAPEFHTRTALVLSAGLAVRGAQAVHEIQLRERVGTNVALAVSPIEHLEGRRSTNLWPELRLELAARAAQLDQACAALLAGPIKFHITFVDNLRLPHVADYRTLARALAVRAVLAMHDQQSNAMFTNLFALSKMVTAWEPEPADICHLVRFAVLDSAEQALWESMQTDLWNEPQLAVLQAEWESVQLLAQLPETFELNGASMTRLCRRAREERYSQKIDGWGTVLRTAITAPRTGLPNLWASLKGYRAHAAYRDRGGYEEEKALLLHFAQRHDEAKRAVAASTWHEMREIPGVTNVVPFRGSPQSLIASMMNLRQMSVNLQGQGRTLLARAAEAECKRRIIITALALERFALEHRRYPQHLRELVPAFVPAVPLDFMDGEALRYRREDDGRYLLHSIGLDGMDDGGQMLVLAELSQRRRPRAGGPRTDIVWPLRARQADVDWFEELQQEIIPEVRE